MMSIYTEKQFQSTRLVCFEIVAFFFEGFKSSDLFQGFTNARLCGKVIAIPVQGFAKFTSMISLERKVGFA